MTIVVTPTAGPWGYGETEVVHRINLIGLGMADVDWDCTGNGDQLSTDALHYVFSLLQFDFLMKAVEVSRHWCRAVLSYVLVVQRPSLGVDLSWQTAAQSTASFVSQREQWSKMKMSKELPS